MYQYDEHSGSHALYYSCPISTIEAQLLFVTHTQYTNEQTLKYDITTRNGGKRMKGLEWEMTTN
jgi:hypothetical protein